jgi:hypothetical protein
MSDEDNEAFRDSNRIIPANEIPRLLAVGVGTVSLSRAHTVKNNKQSTLL